MYSFEVSARIREGGDESIHSLEKESSLVGDVSRQRSMCRWSSRKPVDRTNQGIQFRLQMRHLKSIYSLNTGTQVVPPLPTLSTSIAALTRLDRDSITRFQVSHAGSDGDDLSTRLVPQDKRGLDRIVSNAT